MMKKTILFISFLTLLYTITLAQTITVIDHRNNKDSENKTISVVDHRIPLNMTENLKRPNSIEEMMVYRIQIQITVNQEKENNGNLWVQLTAKDTAWDSKFYLSAPKKLKAGDSYKYDIINSQIRRIIDLDFLKIGGDIAYCITKIELFINNSTTPIYSYGVNSGSITCFALPGPKQLDLLISKNVLRNHPNWNFNEGRKNIWRPAMKITRDWMKSLVEAAIGNGLIAYNRPMNWRSQGNSAINSTQPGWPVKVTFFNEKTLKVDLDFISTGYQPKPVDITFQLNFRCVDGQIRINAGNIEVATNLSGEAGESVKRYGKVLIDLVIGTSTLPDGGPKRTYSDVLRNALAFLITNLDPPDQEISISCTKTVVVLTGDIILNNL